MNPNPPTPETGEHEWQLQEAAFAQERAGEAGGGAPRQQAYRLLARALREPPDVGLPADFARELARRVARERLLDGRWERRLLLFMLLVLGLACASGLLLQGHEWLRAWQQLLPSLPRWANGWTLLLLVGLAWAPVSGLLFQTQPYASTGSLDGNGPVIPTS